MTSSQPRPALPLRVWIPGRARTKGSMRAVGTRGHMVEQVTGSGEWRATVARACLEALGAGSGPWGPIVDWRPAGGPVGVNAAFWLPRPKGARHEGARWAAQDGRNDLDKLARNLGDALVDAQVIADDGLIAHWGLWKLWTDDPWSAGVMVEVVEL